jgi:hypothetical protein
MPKTEKHHVLAMLASGPFLIAGCLLVAMLLSPWSGFPGPSSNAFFVGGAVAVAAALVTGLVALLVLPRPRGWVRLLIGVLYIPVVLMSLLLIGA